MFRRSMLYRLLILSALVILPVPAFAIPLLSISSPSADGTFVLRGDQMAGVAGIDVRITYDASKLSNPRVTMGSLVSGMMSASNPTNPIRMAIVGTKAIGSGSGIIATITFDRTGSSPGAITAVTGSLIDTVGKKVAMAQPSITNPDSSASGDTQTGTSTTTTQQTTTTQATNPQTGGGNNNGDNPETTTTTTTTGTSHPFTVGGTLTFPTQENQPGEAKQAAPPQTAQVESPEHQLDRPDALPEPEEPAAPETTKAPAQPVTQPKPITSVMESFRLFQGDRTVANLTALFKKDAVLPFSQIPAIGIADGKATVTLVISMATGDKAPNFAFTAAKYVSLNRTPEGEWEVEVKPDKGAVKASVIMLYDGYTQDFPLTVTPRADLVAGKPRPVTEADFQLFLKERGTPSASRFDLNRDGRRDYLDDYIFTANYLVKMQEQGKKKGTK